jgi:hypothetical protein
MSNDYWVSSSPTHIILMLSESVESREDCTALKVERVVLHSLPSLCHPHPTHGRVGPLPIPPTLYSPFMVSFLLRTLPPSHTPISLYMSLSHHHRHHHPSSLSEDQHLLAVSLERRNRSEILHEEVDPKNCKNLKI